MRRPGLLAAAVALVWTPAATAGGLGEEAANRPIAVADRLRVENLSPDGFLSAGGVGEYRGALELVRSSAGLAVINDVGLEHYVRGVAEVPASWPMEALRAQAIAARTYAVSEIGRQEPGPGGDVGAHICATQACQVYVGRAQERAEAGERWMAAVESTAGQLLVRKGSSIRAMYSSGEPLPTPKLEPKSPPAPRASGPAPAPPPPPSDAPPPPLLPVPGLPAPSPSPGAAPPPASPGAPRSAAPPPAATPERSAGAVRFRGHGLGMSQHGALAKAQRGASAATILASYYPGARVARLAPSQLPPTIRVALELVRSSMAVSGSGRFRVLDASGRTLAVAATGDWRVEAGPRGQLRLIPPPGQHAVPQLKALGYEPRRPSPGAEVAVRFRLSAPAIVYLTVDGPTGPAVASHPQLLEAGEQALGLRLPQKGGRHVISIVADAGADRIASVPLSVPVDDASAGRWPASHRGSSPRPALGLKMTALVLWASVTMMGTRRALLRRWVA